MASSELTMTPNGLTVSRNGITISKPECMDENHWFKYVAPRVGKMYSSKGDHVFGADELQPTHGVEERGEGCDGGACAI